MHMTIRCRAARVAGIIAITAILVWQAFASFTCYEHSAGDFMFAVMAFLLVPVAPALVSLGSANPLRAVGACLLLAPWLGYAYWIDCVRPYSGGGASMIYVAVLIWGTPSAVMGALLTGPVLRLLGVRVAGE